MQISLNNRLQEWLFPCIILHGKSCIQLLEGLYGGAEMINGELIVDNFAGGGLTVMLNADGTPKIWQGEK